MLYFVMFLLGVIVTLVIFPQSKIEIDKVKSKNHSAINDLTIETTQRRGFLRRIFNRKKDQQKDTPI